MKNGQIAFEAYWETINGDKAPEGEWDALPENVKDSWHAAATAVTDHVSPTEAQQRLGPRLAEIADAR